MAEEKVNLLELLAKNEEKVSELYSIFADKFKGLHDFWLVLSKEETNHAEWIRHLNNPLLSGSILLDEKRFRLEAIALFGNYLAQKVKEATEKDLTSKEALSIALDIENALIERRWFDSIQTDSAEARLSLNRLREALPIHRNKIIEAMDRPE